LHNKNAIKVSPFPYSAGCLHRIDDTTNANSKRRLLPFIRFDSTTKENVKGIYQMFFRNPIPLEAVVFDDYEIHIVPHEFYKICEENGMNKGMIYEPIILV
jgi:hypothetical protein